MLTRLYYFYKKLTCKHDYKLIKTRRSDYCSDYQTFFDLGMYDDHLYECSKCGKQKLITVQNSSHPCYKEWHNVEKDGAQ